MSDAGTRLEVDENALQPQRPPANQLMPDLRKPEKPSDVFRFIGNVASIYGQHVAEQIWNAGPGTIQRVMSGELKPGTPEFNQAAGETAMTYGMMGAPMPRPYGSLGQFGAYHGTRSRFRQFSDEFIGSGEGHQSYGQGHYVGGAEATGESYQRSIGGHGLVPADAEGMPITGVDLARKYYEPGQIVVGYGGEYDRVRRFHDLGDGNWAVDVQQVSPVRTADPSGHPQPGDLARHLAEPDNPDLWQVVAGERRHRTMPDERALERVGKIRGWQMRPPGHLMDVWVKPEHHEFLDWDLPVSKQEPGVQKLLRDYGIYVNPSNTVTGKDIYKKLADTYMPAVRNEGLWGREAAVEAERRASKHLDSIGIAGNRYLDQFSRDPKLEYHGTEPMHPVVENYFGPGHGFKDHTYLKARLESGADLNDTYKAGERMMLADKRRRDPNATLTEHDKDWLWGSAYQSVDQHLEALDWLDKNKQHFQPAKQTYNYVVFNPENLEVRAIDKIPVSRFEGDPYAK